jgi:hypothetical protein
MTLATDIATLEKDVVKVEGWFLTGIEDFAKVVPAIIAAFGAAAGGLGLPAWVGQLLSAVPGMVSALEQALPASGNGVTKITALLTGVESICTSLDGVAVVAADATFGKIKGIVTEIASGAVAAANALAPPAAS